MLQICKYSPNVKVNEILVNSGPQLQTSVQQKRNIYDLFQVWHTNESKNLAKSHQTMTSSAFDILILPSDASVLIF